MNNKNPPARILETEAENGSTANSATLDMAFWLWAADGRPIGEQGIQGRPKRMSYNSAILTEA